MPTGSSPNDYPLFAAVDILARVQEINAAAASDAGGHVASSSLPALPRGDCLRGVVERAVSMDPGGDGKQPWGIKSCSYLMRCADVLPLPSSPRAARIPGIEAFYGDVLSLSQDSLRRDGRTSDGDSDVLFRIARCRYALGDMDAAQADMERAMDLLDPTKVGISAEYHLFRQRIESAEASQNAAKETRRIAQRSEQTVKDQIDGIDERVSAEVDAAVVTAKDDLRSTINEAESDTRKVVAESTFRIVEVLGVFLALIGIIGTTVGATALGSGSLTERAAVLGVGFFGCGLFFWLLRRITNPLSERRGGTSHRRR